MAERSSDKPTSRETHRGAPGKEPRPPLPMSYRRKLGNEDVNSNPHGNGPVCTDNMVRNNQGKKY